MTEKCGGFNCNSAYCKEIAVSYWGGGGTAALNKLLKLLCHRLDIFTFIRLLT